MWKAFLLIAFFFAAGNAKDCVPRSFGVDKVVCVCNSTYCDDTPVNDPKVPEDGTFYWYVSTKEGQRLKLTKARFDSNEESSSADETLTVDSTKKYQKIMGFGAAFTDATGINVKNLSQAAQDQFLRTYFDQETGSRYAFGRVPIGGTDFSTRLYTYDAVSNDTTLKHFALTKEDYLYKAPLMQEALKLNPNLKFFGAVWTPPSWIKDKAAMLDTKYYQLYANYILKFLDGYKEQGLDFWAVSTGNEPLNGFIPGDPLHAMGWTPSTAAKWIANNLGPSLARSEHNKTLILALDDNRFQLPCYLAEMFLTEDAKKYVAGVAVHWYFDNSAPPVVLDVTHAVFPDKFIMMTEACTGNKPTDVPKVDLGSWERGEKYMLSILEYMNNWAVSWVDWNLALDKTGGPNFMNNSVDSAVIVDPETDEFLKQPMFYAIKHFSRFIDVDSDRVHITETEDVKATAALTPSNEVVVVMYNRKNTTTTVTVNDVKKGSLTVQVPALSMNTIIYGQ